MVSYNPTIIRGEQRQDDEILAKTPLDATALGGDSSVLRYKSSLRTINPRRN